MNKNSREKLIEYVKKTFSFLEENFNFESFVSNENGREIVMLTKNEKTGIRIVIDLMEGYPFIFVSKLSETKELPHKLGEIRPDTKIFEFDLDDLVDLKSRKSNSLQVLSIKDPVDLFEEIRKQSENLREYGTEILEGKFSVFMELDAIVKKRACQSAYEKWGDDAKRFGWKTP